MANIPITNRTKVYEYVRSKISNWTETQMDKQLEKYGKQANRRMEILEKHEDAYSPAYHAQFKRVEGDNVKIKTNIEKGQNSLNEKRRELIRAIDFLEDDTSTLAGTKRYKAEVKRTLGLEDKRVSNQMLSNIWYVINKAREVQPVIVYYKSLGEKVYDIVKQYDFQFSDSDSISEEQEQSIDDATKQVVDALQASYEELQESFRARIRNGSTF